MKKELVFFRMEIIKKTKILDTTKCIAVGFLNVGINPVFLNRIYPVPTQNPNNSNNMVWFPMTEGERDATRYELFFSGPPSNNSCLVVYKEPYSNG